MNDRLTTGLVWGLILVLSTWFYFLYIPAQLVELSRKVHEPRVEYVPTYDCYEYDPTYEPGKYESENEGAP